MEPVNIEKIQISKMLTHSITNYLFDEYNIESLGTTISSVPKDMLEIFSKMKEIMQDYGDYIYDLFVDTIKETKILQYIFDKNISDTIYTEKGLLEKNIQV